MNVENDGPAMNACLSGREDREHENAPAGLRVTEAGKKNLFGHGRGGRSVLCCVDAADDSLLVAAFRRGDPAALRAIYARFSHRIFRYLVRIAGRRDVAEDLHQETWIAAARHAPRLAPDTDLAAWLFTIARNKHRSWLRWAVADAARHDRRVETTAAPAPDAAVETRHDLERALRSMPEIHREILVLVGCEGLATEQAAAVLDLTPEATRQRLSRARAALAEALAAAPKSASASGKVVALRKEAR
jgi:RNA polymerase sigma-70 factor (ECF subfamily)